MSSSMRGDFNANAKMRVAKVGLTCWAATRWRRGSAALPIRGARAVSARSTAGNGDALEFSGDSSTSEVLRTGTVRAPLRLLGLVFEIKERKTQGNEVRTHGRI